MSNTIWIAIGVFAVLIALILILKAVRARQDRLYGSEEEAVEVAAAAPVVANRAELAAVAASCIAEVMGKDVSGLRIVSIKQLN
jgi:Na+-transporting methylmalonyl-CoA/oxaloacetate decarboxylase gamma subunit